MPKGPAKKLSRASIRAAVERAEAKSRGEETLPAPTPLDPPETKAIMGRPTDYDPLFVPIVRELCENGATESEIAHILGVSTRSIYRWKLEHKDFCLAISVGKHIADTRVERSLYSKAVGFTYTEQQAVKVKLAEGFEEVRVVEVEKYAQPELQAQQFWLKNRKPMHWRDVQQHEIGRPGEFQSMTDDELKGFLLKEAPEMLTLIVEKEDGTKH